jgi:cobalt-zinc-cadmium efflux system membrane fusion protein
LPPVATTIPQNIGLPNVKIQGVDYLGSSIYRVKELVALLVLSTIVVACGEGNGSAATREAVRAASSKSLPLPAVQKQFLTIEPVGASRAVDLLALPGRVAFAPRAQSAIGATVAGRVVALLVRAGEKVRVGAPLLTIDSADAAAARAALEQASTRLTAADSAYRRNIAMVEKGVGLESERQEAETRLKEARAEYERARQTVGLLGPGDGSRLTVIAPSDGVVMAVRVAPGATVSPGGEPLLEIGDPSRLQVVAQVLESDLSRLAVGQEADVELPALAARVVARVESFNPRVDPESRRSQVYLALSKRIAGLRAGMLAQIELRVDPEEGISVPVSAVLIKDGKRRVVYVERSDGTFEVRDVQTGHNRDGRVVVMQGLQSGEKVVVRGALLLDAQAEQLL